MQTAEWGTRRSKVTVDTCRLLFSCSVVHLYQFKPVISDRMVKAYFS